MDRFTLRQLHFAASAAELGSVAAAAAKHGVAQPSVSAAIRKLEDQLGFQLFIRQHAQGVLPSAQGQKFLMDARNLLQHASDLGRSVERDGNGMKGEVGLGCFPTLAPLYVPRLLSSFSRHFPSARVRLQEGVQEQLLAGLREGKLDLALLYRVDLPEDIRAVDVATLAPHVLLPVGHVLARKSKVSLRALADEKLVLLDVQPSRTYFMRVLARAGIMAVPSYSSPSIELVRGLVAQGLGYSLLITRPAGDRTYDGGRLAVRPIAEDVEPGIVSIASLGAMRLNRTVAAFEASCVTSFRSFGRNQ